jgi:hypothetical protein
LGEEGDDLKSSAEPQLGSFPVGQSSDVLIQEVNFTAVWLNVATDEIKKSRFPGPIWAYDQSALALFDGQIDRLGDVQSLEGFVEIVKSQDVHGGVLMAVS